MHGEYGYMEEGSLGKPYDLSLLRRLARYGRPYAGAIAGALALTVVLTVFDLAIPYLTKIAIDRFILAAWHQVDPSRLPDGQARVLSRRYGHLLTRSSDGSSEFVSTTGIKKMDPADVHHYRSAGVIGAARLYRTGGDMAEELVRSRGREAVRRLADGSALVPYELLERLPDKDLLRVRAGDIRGVSLVAVVFMTFLLLSFGFGFVHHYLLEWTGQHIMQDIRLELFRTMQSRSVRFFDRHPLGRLVTRVTNDIENLNEMFKSVFVTVFKDFFLLAGILGVLLYLDGRLALWCFAFVPCVFVITLLFSTMAREAFRELRAAVAKLNAFLQERISGMRIVQLFAREESQLDAFEAINRDNYLAGMKQIRVFAVFMPIMELISSLALALLIWYGGGRVIGEQLSLGGLVAFIAYMQLFFKPIRDMSEKYNIMQSAMASAERIFEFMDAPEEIPEPDEPRIPPVIEGHLVFDDVSFAYEAGRPVLRQVSLELKPGETVAIVGATGSGKSTVVNLAERFYDPDCGTVLLDGVDLRQWPVDVLRSTVSVVMQDVFIFAGTVEDNIKMGRRNMPAHLLEAALDQSNARPFIERLPHGMGQELGEGGVTLSAGERQLLSFARVLAQAPTLLILDEATSSVDPETERLIQEAVGRMASRRTTMVVAHRLSTIRKADTILVMHKGRFVEQGTHEELMAVGGVYYTLNRLREEEGRSG